MNWKSSQIKRRILLISFILMISYSLTSVLAVEVPEAVYQGVSNATVMIQNLDYQDVKNTHPWSEEAIYESGMLDIMKGYGNKYFGRKDPVSKQQAIAIAYRIVGREADAQMAAEMIDNTRQEVDKKTNALSLWSDGYLQLAANEGLITPAELQDAFTNEPETLTEKSFYRNAPATREEMAFWIAKALNLSPQYSQQKIFNNFQDWQSADPLKIPYIEAILQNNIMNGNGAGRFHPKQSLTREQAAQIVKNAEGVILPLRQYEKKLGTIEKITASKDYSSGNEITQKTFHIRNSNGKLHQINIKIPNHLDSTYQNEQNGQVLPYNENDLVVYKKGALGKSQLLSEGDRIEYMTAPGNTVPYVKVLSSTKDTKYIAAQVVGLDIEDQLIEIAHPLKMDYPDIDLEGNVSFDKEEGDMNRTYRYSSDVEVMMNDKKLEISALALDYPVVLTIQNNVVVEIKSVDLSVKKEIPQEKGIVKGIVEDNNPELGYITLYNENGTRGKPENLHELRTFTYSNPQKVEVYRNYKKSGLDHVRAGDSVFLKVDDSGNVEAVSAVDNYTVKYGKVISKSPGTLVVEYEDGTQQILDVDSNVFITADKKLTNFNSIKDGDRVKLVLNITDQFTEVKEIEVEGDKHLVSNIYKGKIDRIDPSSNQLVAINVEVLDRGKWIKTGNKGVTPIKLANDFGIYYESEEMDLDSVNKYLKSSEAYVAVEKDYGGEEQAIRVSFRRDADAEVLYDDTVAYAPSGAGAFSISKEPQNIQYGLGTIIVKYNRLVAGNSIASEDLAYVVANRDNESGKYHAGVVMINEEQNQGLLKIYRARIKEINEGADFSVQSFSELKGLAWEFTNAPKTFRITNSTRIVDDGGVVSTRDFTGYGEDSYIDEVVYIVANELDAVLVSTAPYGVYHSKGEVYEVTGATIGEEGTQLSEPTGVNAWKVKEYDTTNHLWVDGEDSTFNILKNTLIIKDDRIIKPSELKKGDQIRVVKKEDSETSDACVILVEG